jgi:sugar/nucleoside kinase (ribokinase family)
VTTTSSPGRAWPPERTIDVVGIGNALVDVLAHESEEFVAAQGIVKGSMTLIDAQRSAELYAAMSAATEVSGGSAANTVVGVASFGGTAAYIGKVRDDQLGAIFSHDIRALGVEYPVPPAVAGEPTGRCLIFVTPDGQRTMNTFLGASNDLNPEDVPETVVARAKVLYMEGYLWDPPHAKAAMRHAASLASGDDQCVSLTLSDSFCVDRHRDSFVELIESDVDILFANEDELRSLYQVDDLDTAIATVRRSVQIAAVTMGARGSVVVTEDGLERVPAVPVRQRVDTTGAGDLYAAGFLYGFTQGHDLELCGILGSLAASEIISHMGPRPEQSLSELAAPYLVGSA